jgi:RNase P subunit RPR2
MISQPFTEAAVLPERVFCDACGAILYDGPELESPIEIIQRYNGICPKCQKALSYQVDRVGIVPYDENLIRSKARHKWAL